MVAQYPERGGNLKDSEFYTVSEEWPQPPDDSCTLESVHGSSSAKPKKKSSSRVRKKMSESLAGVTAAAVSLVLVASSLPGMKDVVDDFPIQDILGESCPICRVEDCPYYYDGMEGLTLSYPAKPEYLPYDLYKMNGYTDRDKQTCKNCHAITTADYKRLVFYADNELTDLMAGHQHWTDFGSNMEHPIQGEPSVSGFSIMSRDEKSDEYLSAFFVYLVYSPEGNYSGFDISNEIFWDDVTIDDLDFRAFPVEGIPNAQIHIYTDLGAEFMGQAIRYCHVDVAEGFGTRHSLGETMYFQETDWCFRTYYDEHLWSWVQTFGFNEGDGEVERYFTSSLDAKKYSISDLYGSESFIEFITGSWVEVFEKYAKLNAEAPKLGHKAYFPIQYLGETSVNGITYLCYVAYTDSPVDDVNHYQWATYLCIPKQEQNIIFVDSVSISPEEITALLSGKLDADYLAERMAILSQVTLR